jgi:CBS domain-containing protein
MAQERVRRLAVVDREGELPGVVSLADLARIEDTEGNLAAAALRVISMRMDAAKALADEDPTGGRARGSPAGTLHVYGQHPRIRRHVPPSSSG